MPGHIQPTTGHPRSLANPQQEPFHAAPRVLVPKTTAAFVVAGLGNELI